MINEGAEADLFINYPRLRVSIAEQNTMTPTMKAAIPNPARIPPLMAFSTGFDDIALFITVGNISFTYYFSFNNLANRIPKPITPAPIAAPVRK